MVMVFQQRDCSQTSPPSPTDPLSWQGPSLWDQPSLSLNLDQPLTGPGEHCQPESPQGEQFRFPRFGTAGEIFPNEIPLPAQTPSCLATAGKLGAYPQPLCCHELGVAHLVGTACS